MWGHACFVGLLYDLILVDVFFCGLYNVNVCFRMFVYAGLCLYMLVYVRYEICRGYIALCGFMWVYIRFNRLCGFMGLCSVM